MNRIEFNGETYETDEKVFMTDEGAVFLPAIIGEVVTIEPGSVEELVIRKHEYAACMNAFDAIQSIKREDDVYVVAADLKIDVDLAVDFVGIGHSFAEAINNLFYETFANHPELCVCKNPAEDERFK